MTNVKHTLDSELIAKAQKMLSTLPPAARDRVGALIAEARKVSAQKLVDTNFMEFVKYVWPGFIHGAHHERMARMFEQIAEGKKKRLIINLPPRHALLTTTLIPTLEGFRTLADVQPGEFVFGPDGAPVQILGKSEVFHNRQLYRVSTDDGFSVIVDGEHLWTVRMCRKTKQYFPYTTEQLWERQNGAMFRPSRKTKDITRQNIPPIAPERVRAPMLPSVSAVEYAEKELLVDPYVLGIWLGDGTTNSGVISGAEEDACIIREEITRRGYTTTAQSTPDTFGILGLKVKLRELGVLNNKHIPTEYLYGSIKQRRDLLKGLMDTDGNVSVKGQAFWAQSNRNLIDQVRTLLAGLGIKNSVSETEAKFNGVSYGPTWRISFYASDIAVLPRKESRTRAAKGDWYGRYITVEKLQGTGDTQCIKVAREDGLFLVGDGYICTHNTKSEFASFLLPSWFLGKYPEKKIIQASHTAELAVGFGRKVRNLVNSERYKDLFPGVGLQADSKAAGRWSTNKGGEYFAIGIGGAVTGKGADLLIIDDPHAEQEAALAEINPEIYDKTYEWYTSGPRQRLQPGGSILIVMTRWSKRDLTAQVLKAAAQRGGDDWEVIEFPALFDSGEPLWPQFWSKTELDAIKQELPNSKWMAQYQQNPTSEVSAIIKREWWKAWEKEDPPKCDFTLMSWDTAFEKSTRADYSACTLWGVFYRPDDTGMQQANIILINAFRARMEFPELKKRAIEQWKEWQPDAIIIEKKASGAPLIYEMRAMGIPVQEYTPTRGNDKITRLNSISDVFASGRVWAPETHWAEEVIDEVASFPAGEHDDYVDSVSLAMMRFRQGGYIRTLLDEVDEPQYYKRRADPYY